MKHKKTYKTLISAQLTISIRCLGHAVEPFVNYLIKIMFNSYIYIKTFYPLG